MKKSLVRNVLHIKPVHMYRLLEWDKGQTPSGTFGSDYFGK